MEKLSVIVVNSAGIPIGRAIRQKDLDVAIAVHARGIEEILRDLGEEAFEYVDGHAEMGRDVDETSPRSEL